MRARLAFAVLSSVVVSCTPSTAPTPPGVDAAVSPLPPPHAVATGDDAAVPVAPVALIEAGAPTVATAAPPPAGDPGTLPQTKDKPAASSPALDARAASLWDAIVHDDPDRGMPFFFPVAAYEQVKAITFASSDWKNRLVSAYKRDVHGLAKRLGSKAESAKFVRLEVPDDRARWVDINEESNKLGYYRVYGTRIVYEVDGKERSFDISSLISWRGEWYVVHLTGFK